MGKFKKAIDDVYKEKEEIKSKKVEVKTEKGKEEPKIKEETKSASTEQKAEPVSKLEVRPQVGEEAPLRQPSKEPAGKEKKVKTQPAKEETLEGKKFILENKEYTFNGKKKPNGDYVAVDSKGYKIGITERALKTLNYVGEVKEQPKEAGVEEVRDLHEQRGEEVPTGRREVVKGKTTEKGIVFKDITYEKESQIKEALDKGGITKPEYEQAVNMLNSKNFND